MIPFDPAPPHSPEAEMAVLGACLISATATRKALDLVERPDFYLEVNRRVFDAVQALALKNRPGDVLTVPEWLRGLPKPPGYESVLALVGGVAYVNSLADSVPTAAHVEHYCGLLRRHAERRRLLEFAAELRERVDADEEPEQIAAWGAASLVAAARDTQDDARSLVHLAAVEVERVQKGEPRPALGTGLRALDRLCGGIERGELGVVAGRPGSGKSSLAQQMLEHTARTWGPAVLFTLEMQGEAIALRGLAGGAGIEYQRLRDAGDYDWQGRHVRLQDSELLALVEALEQLQELPHDIWVDDRPVALSRLQTRAQRFQAQHGIQAVFVDYTQLVSDDTGRNHGRAQETANVSKGLKLLAKTLKVPVWGLAQVNREVEKRAGKDGEIRLRMSDLNWSGQLEQDASVILALNAEKDQTIASILKARNGRIGELPLQFWKSRYRFVEATDRKEFG